MNTIVQCSEAEYRKIAAANYSLLKQFKRSPSHALHEKQNPREGTPAMWLGLAVDCLIFSPADFVVRFAEAPDVDRRTKKGMTEWAAFVRELNGRTPLKREHVHTAKLMADAIRSHPLAAKMIVSQRYQTPIVWTDPETRVVCKALIDAITPGVTITDCKTTTDASEFAFSRKAASMRYHWQAAMYCDGWKAVSGEDLPYTFIVCEQEAPHGVAVYRLDDDAIAAGRRQYREALVTYAECVRSGVWPSYSADLVTLELPKWALADYTVPAWPDEEHPF